MGAPTYDTSSPVLVTGATGYVAGWLVRRLLEEGFTVHGAVRDPSNAAKVAHLDALAEELPGAIRYFRADLLDEGSYGPAMEGCRVVFHTASPFVTAVDDPQRDLVDPALNGTRNVLGSADRTESVRRVVVTSSAAAVYGDNADLAETKTGSFTEEDWNTTSSLDHQPYSYSKVAAERAAWEIAGAQSRWDLVTVNPSLVLGPGISPNATSESFALMKQLADGTMRTGAPDFAFGAVDVRDVAEAHLRAAFVPAAQGRYIVSGADTDFLEIARILRRELGGDWPFPRWTLPKWLLWLVGPFVNKTLTRKTVRLNVGLPARFDSSKSRTELGMAYRPLKESVLDMFRQMIAGGALTKR